MLIKLVIIQNWDGLVHILSPFQVHINDHTHIESNQNIHDAFDISLSDYDAYRFYVTKQAKC